MDGCGWQQWAQTDVSTDDEVVSAADPLPTLSDLQRCEGYVGFDETRAVAAQHSMRLQSGASLLACVLDNRTFGGCGRVVAWDPVPWPGKDFYRNARATDDGVKAA